MTRERVNSKKRRKLQIFPSYFCRSAVSTTWTTYVWGGVILFDRDALTGAGNRNIVSVPQVKALTDRLQRAANIPLFVGVDQEGGKVRRFKAEHGVSEMPSPEAMGKQTPEETRNMARALGATLHAGGVNLDFAPSLDVNVNSQSPAIGALGRSFSADAAIVTVQGKAFAEGLGDSGILSCYKHFPGHGSATADTHMGLADVTATWREAELAPYRALLKSNVHGMVMVGHMAQRHMDKNLPASLSRLIIQGLLRRGLGWQGVVITDDMQMGAIEKSYSQETSLQLAINAGVDIILLGNNLRHDAREGRTAHAVIMKLVREGKIPHRRIVESYNRIIMLKESL